MIQLIAFVFAIALFIAMPKQNKKELQAIHLLIDHFQLPIKKTKRNNLTQLIRIEKEIGIDDGYYAARKKLTKLQINFMGIFLILGGISVALVLKNFESIGLIFFGISIIYMVIGFAYVMLRMYKVQVTWRKAGWIKILNKLDPKLNTESFENKNWQESFLHLMESYSVN